jgi:hypothetical protein
MTIGTVRNGPKSPERSFGVSVGSVLCLLAALLVWRRHMPAGPIVGAVGLALVAFALLYPRALRGPSAVWWRLSRGLAFINSRIILLGLFLVVLIPIGLVWRLFGIDPLVRRRQRWRGWSDYPARLRNPQHHTRMY